jgi:GxxExxY protein
MDEPSQEHDRIAHEIVDSALAVHRAAGPGLLKTVYEQCLGHEIHSRQIPIMRHVTAPLIYRDLRVEAALRIDFVIGNLVALELKVADRILPVHEAQMRSYLRLSGYQLGLLINFNVVMIREGIKRIVCTR